MTTTGYSNLALHDDSWLSSGSTRKCSETELVHDLPIRFPTCETATGRIASETVFVDIFAGFVSELSDARIPFQR